MQNFTITKSETRDRFRDLINRSGYGVIIVHPEPVLQLNPPLSEDFLTPEFRQQMNMWLINQFGFRTAVEDGQAQVYVDPVTGRPMLLMTQNTFNNFVKVPFE